MKSEKKLPISKKYIQYVNPTIYLARDKGSNGVYIYPEKPHYEKGEYFLGAVSYYERDIAIPYITLKTCKALFEIELEEGQMCECQITARCCKTDENGNVPVATTLKTLGV